MPPPLCSNTLALCRALQFVGIPVYLIMLSCVAALHWGGATMLVHAYESLDEEPSFYHCAVAVLGVVGGWFTQLCIMFV